MIYCQLCEVNSCDMHFAINGKYSNTFKGLTPNVMVVRSRMLNDIRHTEAFLALRTTKKEINYVYSQRRASLANDQLHHSTFHRSTPK